MCLVFGGNYYMCTDNTENTGVQDCGENNLLKDFTKKGPMEGRQNKIS